MLLSLSTSNAAVMEELKAIYREVASKLRDIDGDDLASVQVSGLPLAQEMDIKADSGLCMIVSPPNEQSHPAQSSAHFRQFCV